MARELPKAQESPEEPGHRGVWPARCCRAGDLMPETLILKVSCALPHLGHLPRPRPASASPSSGKRKNGYLVKLQRPVKESDYSTPSTRRDSSAKCDVPQPSWQSVTCFPLHRFRGQLGDLWRVGDTGRCHVAGKSPVCIIKSQR